MDNSKPFTWAADLLSKTEGPYIKDVTRYEQIHDLLSEAQREDMKRVFGVSNQTFFESYAVNISQVHDLGLQLPELAAHVYVFESMLGRRMGEIEDAVSRSALKEFDDAMEGFVKVLKGINPDSQRLSEGLEKLFIELAKRKKYFEQMSKYILPA
ncbi:MAG: hypothetical protein LQ339_006648 [Xanthoria mediterranea]|nr:MAG: hypothetical protein LQ339_006648 [Xanthoria mediterranea]